MAIVHSFRKPAPFATDSDRDEILGIVERIKRADEKNQASRSPLKAVSKDDKKFQEDANLPVEFFDFFKIEKVG